MYLRRFGVWLTDFWPILAVGVLVVGSLGIGVYVYVDTANDPTSGVVYKEEYHAAGCTLVGKVIFCHPEKWCLEYRNVDFPNEDNTGEVCSHDPNIWQAYPVGSHYPQEK